jgi:uncharacterized protein YdeI (YjbR/CyaY-like superfamily)
MTEENPLQFETPGEWRDWLGKNGSGAAGVWVTLQKAKSPHAGIGYDEALDEALCYGWIDGKMRRIDEHRFMQWFSPRRGGSPWSRRNRERAERLIQEKRMAEAGIAEVEKAKANGWWDKAYTSRRPPEVPGDLLEALKASPEAYENFAGFNNSAQLMYSYWVGDAKRPETRARRIARVVELSRQNIKPGIELRMDPEKQEKARRPQGRRASPT